MSVQLTQMCTAPPKSSSTLQSSSAPTNTTTQPMQCSKPPSNLNSNREASSLTASQPKVSGKVSYSTIHNWGPVVGRSPTSCTTERYIPSYSSENNNSEEWDKITSQYPSRQEYEEYNSNIEEGNTIIGNNNRQANYGKQYNCIVENDKTKCDLVVINEDGALAATYADGEGVVCLGQGEEILGVTLSDESSCSQKCSQDPLCAGYTHTGNHCILQNHNIITKNAGEVLGQYSPGIKTNIKNCRFQNGKCVENGFEIVQKNCHGIFPQDHLSITECENTEVEALNKVGKKLEVMKPFQNRDADPFIPPSANDSSTMPVYEKAK